MVRIRNVWVRVGGARMLMDMAVRTTWHGVVVVVVMPVVMAMRVFVLHGVMAVLMCVRLCQVKQHADHHEKAS